MIKFNRTLVYTHKFDKWQYIEVTNYDTPQYSTLEDISSDEESILNCINVNQDEIAYYYLNGYYYQVISTPKDLLQHIKYTPKDNRKHELNRGFHEWKCIINDIDTIPLKLVEFAFKIYLKQHQNCEVDLSQTNCSLNDENISKFLYLANELLGLNIFYKVYSKENKKSVPSSNDGTTISFKDIKDLISSNGIYPTYLNIFVHNLKVSPKINIVNNEENLNTLKWILNSCSKDLENYHDYINIFLTNSGISINNKNIWNYIDNYNIQNSYSLKMINRLKITLNDMISVIINTKHINKSLYLIYIKIINNISFEELKEFLENKKNQSLLDNIYDILKSHKFDNLEVDLSNFKKILNNTNLTSNSIYTLLKLIKSTCIPKNLLLDIVGNIIKDKYNQLFELKKDILNNNSLNLLKNIGVILQFKYHIDISKDLKKFSNKYYQRLFRILMDINVISIECNNGLFKKDNFILDNTAFKNLNKISSQLFWIYNPNFDFSNITYIEKILILTTPELLLKFIDFCETSQKEEKLLYIFIQDNSFLNIGTIQCEYLKYILYQLLGNSNTLNDLLNSLNLQVSLDRCKKYINTLKDYFKKDIIAIHKFSI